ncbi:DNA polymerase III subunit delta' [Nocardioides panzhihuensis]|uniref:DNA polymerase III subunit delta' n=1 Tax=Nocardioides panzhihuensis TaxID=860243 RepID=A0A7Z0DQV7_9ACTN|nr:DNA polymerase III subunit delta' [Nocardioides panzhihuensis]NYI80012.1 DNA polymerase-3 subunit delta' [Nocardioides panzhihuensis]
MSIATTSDGRSVWDNLVGQRHIISMLQTAATGSTDGLGRRFGKGMTQSWLFTGPPGSGRSNAAIAFAAALQCPNGGCGHCHECHTVLAGSHADVNLVRTEKLTLGVDEIRDLVRQAALSPAGSRWQILIIEDADRLTEQANNALLKAVEEPGARTVWMLCAPTVEDVLPTIRSRCRLVTLTTPTTPDVSAFLQRTLGVDEARGTYAARASQGHIGRAKALARDDDTRRRREQVVAYPTRLTTLADALRAAGELAAVSKEEADAVTADLDAKEKSDLDVGYGVVDRGRRPREYGPALAALEKDQKRRATRRHRDVIDRGLMDLVSIYRDAITLAAGAPVALVNEEHRREIEQLVERSTPELNLQRIGAIFEAREQLLEFNVQPQLVLEAMMVALLPPGGDQ